MPTLALLPRSDDDGAAGRAAVLDCGSGTIKAGLAGDDAPAAVFSTLIGRPKYRQALVREGGRPLLGPRFVRHAVALPWDYGL